MHILLNICLMLCLTTAVASADPIILNLWPGDAPGSEGVSAAEVWKERGEGIVDRSVADVHKPTLTVYLPVKEKNTGAAVVIAPGGGYSHLAIDKEGHDVAKWLISIGVTGLVLKYRLPRTKGHNYTTDTALMDAQQAIRITREKASEWNIDPKRVGIMGFSAGGNLTILAGTNFDSDTRPDFLVPIYPAAPKEMNITKDTPPAFLVQADDDFLKPNEHSVRIYLALRQAGVPAELHVYAQGGHGFGIRNRRIPASSWTARFEDWLIDRKFIQR